LEFELVIAGSIEIAKNAFDSLHVSISRTSNMP